MIIIFFLVFGIAVLLIVILYQRFMYRVDMRRKLFGISEKLKEITDSDRDEKIFVFTDNPELMELVAQINHLLENHLKVKVDYRRSRIA